LLKAVIFVQPRFHPTANICCLFRNSSNKSLEDRLLIFAQILWSKLFVYLLIVICKNRKSVLLPILRSSLPSMLNRPRSRVCNDFSLKAYFLSLIMAIVIFARLRRPQNISYIFVFPCFLGRMRFYPLQYMIYIIYPVKNNFKKCFRNRGKSLSRDQEKNQFFKPAKKLE